MASLMNADVIAIKNPKSPEAEAYRTLRTNIQFASIDRNIRSMTITSSSQSEGKSTTIANLAATFAQMGKKVLIVDADLRRPRLHKFFRISNSVGVTTILSQKVSLDNSIMEVDKNLYVLPSGPIPPNPSEIIASNAMKNLIEHFKTVYDVVLIDAPPIGVVTDAAILSSIVDGTLLVVAANKTEIEVAKRAKQLLENVKANVLGVVMTMIPVNNKGYYGYQYYSYYEE